MNLYNKLWKALHLFTIFVFICVIVLFYQNHYSKSHKATSWVSLIKCIKPLRANLFMGHPIDFHVHIPDSSEVYDNDSQDFPDWCYKDNEENPTKSEDRHEPDRDLSDY